MPPLNEIQYFTVLILLITLCFIDTSLFSAFIASIHDDARVLIFPIMGIFITVGVFGKNKLNDSMKVGACLLYYGLFAAIALTTLRDQHFISVNASLLEIINHWLIKILLIFAVARGLISLVVFRLGIPKYEVLVTQNFSDTQYRRVAFICAAAIAVSTAFFLNQFYDNPAILLVLSFSYASILIRVMNAAFRTKFEY